VAAGWASPDGIAPDGLAPGAPGDSARTFITRDAELEAAGLRRPFAARVQLPSSSDRAGELLGAAARALVRELDEVAADWRGRRLAIVLGTSAGGMRSLELALAARAAGSAPSRNLARASLYTGPLAALDALFGEGALRIQLLAACASSTFAIGFGARFLEDHPDDLVIAGGYDALSVFVASGFEALGATTKTAPPRPFRRDRDGMALGEGAALIALGREAPSRGRGYVLGFGATSDAVHVTAPDELGRGLASAAERALADAGLDSESIGLLSAHATATPHNDAAETRVLERVFSGDSAPVVHAYKAVIGHALGAAGALETLSALACLSQRVAPAAVGAGELTSGFRGRLLAHAERGDARYALKLSAAFGGANAALVLGSQPPARAGVGSRHAVVVRAVGQDIVESDLALLERATGRSAGDLARLDAASLLAATAVASVLEQVELADASRTAVVVGTTAASLECNEVFDEVRRRRGAAFAPPRAFPPTSPNVPAGRCAILFALRGPTLGVGGGPGAALEALFVAHALVAGGDACEAVLIAADDTGPVTRDLFAAAELPCPARGAVAAVLSRAEAGTGRPLSGAKIEALLRLAATAAAADKPAPVGCEALRAALLAAAPTSPNSA
jgi:3-oxoacyl-[acyl-carrier-protein] synthase-1/3-oxoacyl-[acyl-carrier-protein] synthase II